jgi:ATP-dependent protease ClpP protease subunit
MLIWNGELNGEFLRRLFRAQEGARLVLCSQGGDCDIMTAAIDLMRGRNWAVHATGSCMSAAVPILAIGGRKERTVSPNCRLMVHLGQMTLRDADIEDMEVEKLELARYEAIYLDVLSRTTKKFTRWWQDMMKGGKPQYFSAEEAVKWGVADRIA